MLFGSKRLRIKLKDKTKLTRIKQSVQRSKWGIKGSLDCVRRKEKRKRQKLVQKRASHLDGWTSNP